MRVAHSLGCLVVLSWRFFLLPFALGLCVGSRMMALWAWALETFDLGTLMLGARLTFALALVLALSLSLDSCACFRYPIFINYQ